MIIDFVKKVWIKAQVSFKIRILVFNKTFITFLAEYFNYNNVFLAKNEMKLLKYTKINDLAIKLKKDK